MKKRIFTWGLPLMAMAIVMCSSMPIGKQDNGVKSVQPTEQAALTASKLSSLPINGKLSYSDLKEVATSMKGSKLSFKEKLALRLFGKKLSKKAMHGDGQNQWIALALCLLFGGVSAHRFYLGYTWQGIVQFLTLGGCGIWWLIDLIRICTGDLKPKDGEYGSTF